MDIIDQAQARDAEMREDSLAPLLRRAQALQVPSGATHCAACGAPIPEGRLRAVPAARHCVDCASSGRP